MLADSGLFLSVGLMISLIVTETIGIATGGLIVPGYLAMHLDDPVSIVTTVGGGLLSYFLVTGLAKHLLIFGRRQIVLCILFGFLIRGLLHSTNLLAADASQPFFGQLAVIGYVIPGLIAISMGRYGVLNTICGLATTTVLVKFAVEMVVSLGSIL